MASKVFEKVGVRRPRHSAFDLSHERKLSCNMGDLIPIYMDEIIPGDEFSVRTETLMRLAPMLAPVMHRVNVYVHFFFVPNRIIWDEWEDFITGGQIGAPPTMTTIDLDTIQGISGNGPGTLADYLGLPVTRLTNGMEGAVTQLPFRAYQKIYNDYYRDDNLITEIDVNNMTNNATLFLRRRAWEKDYFTSSLPFAQRSNFGVELPIEITDDEINYKKPARFFSSNDDDPLDAGNASFNFNVLGALLHSDAGGGSDSAWVDNIDSIDGFGFTIEDLRRSSALQRWLEKSARGGYRYIETILSQFGVKSDDARLQRPEYLGGGKNPVVISEVLNTTGTTEAPQGDMAGHGISSGTTMNFKRSFKEHGYVMGIMSVLPRTAYMQGVHRQWWRNDRFDFFWPDFANLGEQEVLARELYLEDTENEQQSTFGYQQQFAEYKYGCSSVHGDFRTTLDYWHMARNFDSQPVLSSEFVNADPTHRIFANTEEADHKLWCMVYNSVKARRMMPYFADPQLK